MKFAYTNRGANLVQWDGRTAPSQSRAGETKSLGDFYATTRTSGALRRYGGRGAGHDGAAVGYESNRSLGNIDVPRPGAPEVVSGYEAGYQMTAGYESPAPNSATVHLGLGGYIPEGAARNYGSQMLGEGETPAPSPTFDGKIIRRASMLAAAYHGVKRNGGSVLWGLLWALGAYVAPIYGTSVVAVAAAQGFGERKLVSNPARYARGTPRVARGTPRRPKRPRKRKGQKRPRIGGKVWRAEFPTAARRLDARRRKRKAKPYRAKGFV